MVEGLYDTLVLECLTIRLDSPDARIFTLECGGIGALRKKLVTFLRILERSDAGRPVDKVLVFADTGRRSAAELESELSGLLGPTRFGFSQGVEFCPIRQEMHGYSRTRTQ